MKWIVSGIWDRTSQPGSMTVTADSQPEAYALAKARGLTAIEAMGVGGPAPDAPRTNGPRSNRPPPKRATKPKRAPEPKPTPAAPIGSTAVDDSTEDEPTDAPTDTGTRSKLARLPRSPLRARAARLATPATSPSPTFGLALAAFGLALIVFGTFLTGTLPPSYWFGEAVQAAGIVGILAGLKVLNA